MKRILLSALLLISTVTCFASDEDRHSASQVITTNSSTSVPTALSTTDIWFTRATVLGLKAARTANSGDVYIGPTSSNDAQPFKVLSSGEVVIQAQVGTKLNLKEWYLDVTIANDGVVIIWQ